ncbi:DedA family protein [Aliiroseovarius sp. 2305UL8-7]|uniref:DedA family protein n=1 Tax=Aliiroseovarius conchicola TaxID=3121637 RepID=UPI0035286C28
MIDTVLALIPDYGLFLVFGVVFLACLAVPLPASMLVLTAGSFAAAGDFSFVLVVMTTFVAFILGDQLAFALASRFGRKLIARLSQSDRFAPILNRSEALLQKHGALSVLMSHTIISPTCPYISYLSGAGGLPWRSFTGVAVMGALIWTLAYVGLGYVFATQLEQVATLLSNFFGVVLAVATAIGALLILRSRWKKMRDAPA